MGVTCWPSALDDPSETEARWPLVTENWLQKVMCRRYIDRTHTWVTLMTCVMTALSQSNPASFVNALIILVWVTTVSVMWGCPRRSFRQITANVLMEMKSYNKLYAIFSLPLELTPGGLKEFFYISFVYKSKRWDFSLSSLPFSRLDDVSLWEERGTIHFASKCNSRY